MIKNTRLSIIALLMFVAMNAHAEFPYSSNSKTYTATRLPSGGIKVEPKKEVDTTKRALAGMAWGGLGRIITYQGCKHGIVDESAGLPIFAVTTLAAALVTKPEDAPSLQSEGTFVLSSLVTAALSFIVVGKASKVS